MKQMSNLFGDVVKFIWESEENSATRRRLRQCVDDLPTRARLQMQLAATVEFGEPFVQATYRLEGDGPLSMKVYEEMRSLSNFANAELLHQPSSAAMARTLSNGNDDHYQAWMQVAYDCLDPAVQYFNRRFAEGGALFPVMQAFRAARMLHPGKANEMQPTVQDIGSLDAFPFITPQDIDVLRGELPAYLAAVEDAHSGIDPVVCWRGHPHLEGWRSIFRKVLLVQPSSAAAERVFSLLQASFSDRQERALEDYIEASIMLQYNQ